MKNIVLFLFLLSCTLSYAQVNENSTGNQSFSIQKENKTENKSGSLKFNIKTVKVSENSAKSSFNIKAKDETAPIITIISPEVKRGFKPVEATKLIKVIGKVEDESGIFEVLVNDIEATVATDGTFEVSVPLAFGDNELKIKATDIKMNSDFVTFTIERKRAMVSAAVNTDNQTNTANSITWQQPNNDNDVTTEDKITLMACIKSSQALKSLKIYQNGWVVMEKNLENIIKNGDCSYFLNETIKLKVGNNEIKVEVVNETKTFESQKNVNCNMMTSKNYALIIAVQDYNDNAINDLEEPIKDAQKVYNVLTEYYTFDKQNITFFKNPTKAEIIGTLHKMRSTITSEDNLLIFYAGHGYYDQAMNNGYWLPSDANQDNPVNWLPNTDLTNYLSVIKSKHTLLIADACFSGGIFKSRNAFNNNNAIEQLYKIPSRKAITSGTLTEVPDKSVFIQYFVQRLKENKEKYLTAEQLFSSLRFAVISNSSVIPQYGTIQNVGDEGGDFIFIKK